MVNVKPAPEDQKNCIARLMQLYEHDLSRFEKNGPGEDGLFPLSCYFDLYWTEADRFPYLIYDGVSMIGFALVRQLDGDTRSIAEFFIVRSARGEGKGATAAGLIFDLFPGRWEVAQLKDNVPSQKFWMSVIGKYTDGTFEESWSEESPHGPKQTFRTG